MGLFNKLTGAFAKKGGAPTADETMSVIANKVLNTPASQTEKLFKNSGFITQAESRSRFLGSITTGAATIGGMNAAIAMATGGDVTDKTLDGLKSGAALGAAFGAFRGFRRGAAGRIVSDMDSFQRAHIMSRSSGQDIVSKLPRMSFSQSLIQNSEKARAASQSALDSFSIYRKTAPESVGGYGWKRANMNMKV